MPGRTWESGKCLFIREFVLQAEHRTAAYIGASNGHFKIEKIEKGQTGRVVEGKIVPDEASYRPVFDYSTITYTLSPPKAWGQKFGYSPLVATSTDIVARAKRNDPAEFYINEVLNALALKKEVIATRSGYTCSSGVPGQVCPRIAIWARGTVAPCTIRPF